MESQTNNALDGDDATGAWHGIQHLDMPDLDVPNLGEITSTFEPITDATPAPGTGPAPSVTPASSTPLAHPATPVSDSAESVMQGNAAHAGMSDSPESVTQSDVAYAGMSDSPESVTQGSADSARLSDSAESDMQVGPSTQEMSEVHARSYAASIPHPTGAAAAERPPQIPLAPVKRVQAQFNPLADGLLYLVVFVGGFVGAAMRFGLALAFPSPLARRGVLSAFHVATFGANMLACLLLALVTICVSQASWLTRRVKQLISKGVGLGLCGGCSTLSTLCVEELTSLRDGEIGGTVLYVLLTFVCGVLCSMLGVKLGLLLTARRKSQVLHEAVRNAMRSDGGSGPVVEGMPQRVADQLASGGAVDSADAEALIAAEAPIVVDRPVAVPSESDGAQGDSGESSAADKRTATGIPAFEPAPITDEIPLVGDLATGEVVELPASAQGAASAPAADTGEIPSVAMAGSHSVSAAADSATDSHDATAASAPAEPSEEGVA